MMKNINKTSMFIFILINAIIIVTCKKEDSNEKNIPAQNTPPVAAFTVSPSSGSTETQFEFDASGSSDKEDALSVLKVRWDWENDGTWDTDWSSNKKINHNYKIPGNFTIALEVKDSQGLANSETHNVTVQEEYNNTPPNAIFTISPTSGTTSTIFEFDGSGSLDNEDPVEDLQIRWDFDGDGSWDTNWDFDKIENHQYSSEDEFTVKMEVKDTEGLTDVQINIVNVSSSGGQGEPCPGTPTIYYQGQVYNTVLIGNQCWLKENLNVGTRIDGSEEMTDNGTIEKYCYDDDENNCDTYGGLYQWDEMMQYTTTVGAKGICPDGWHVPSDAEWDIVVNYLGGSGVAGGKMKEAGTAHWNAPNTGATNESGFTALPGGYRYTWGSYFTLGGYGGWWSSSESSSSIAWGRGMHFYRADVCRYGNAKESGFSVRCLKD